MKHNIVLIGMRGSGKTTIGKKLAKRLGLLCIDTDAEIEQYENRTISKIVETDGWKRFRSSESYICSRVAQENNVVISTGAGVILDSRNIQELKKNGLCVFLNIPIGMIVSRLSRNQGDHRPHLTQQQSFSAELREIHRERYRTYCQSADHICRKIRMREIIEDITQVWESREKQKSE